MSRDLHSRRKFGHSSVSINSTADGLMVRNARRTLQQGGAYVNNARISDDKQKVGADALVHGMMMLVRSGKKNLRLVRAI